MMKNRRGSVAAMSAVLIIGVVAVAGLAIDLTRVWLVSARLKTSVDAAALVAARQIDSPTRDADARALFMANYTQNGAFPNTPVGRYLGAALVTPNNAQITSVGTRQVRVTARARVGTTLFGIISPGTTDVEETTLAEREGTGLELAISLDATYSMLDAAPGGGTKLEAAQAATRTLLGILFGGADVQNNLWVSVVSFSRTINIGSANSGLLDNANAPPGFNAARWGGCVRARPGANDILDLDPAVTGLPPYWWPSTYRQVGTVEAGVCSATANPRVFYPATAGGQPRFCHGDNDWGSGQTIVGTTPAPPGNTTNQWYNGSVRFWRQAPYNLGAESDLNTAAIGPNFNCSVQPIVPLTESRTAIVAAVDAITVQATAGTITPAGLHGAWYTLSPQWRNRWPGIASGGALGALPLNYNTRNMNKAMILLTDGANVWQLASQFGGVRGSAAGTELLYAYYGRAADYNAGFPAARINPVSALNARAAMDARFAALCTAIKATGIDIYIVGFEVPDAGRRTLLQNCATTTASPYYLEAPTATQLNAAFTTIANQLTSLRMVE
jgi:Flp pilus assembly protein TadG